MRQERYFCDRCGQAISKDKVITIDMDINKALFVAKPHQGTKSYDLCEPCYNSMIKFLNGAALDISEMGK